MKPRNPMVAAFLRPTPPPAAGYAALADAVVAVLSGEPDHLRPADSQGMPGGLVRLDPRLPTIIVPDLHARTAFFLSLMESPLPGGGTVRDALAAGQLQVLCLGDGFHAEARAIDRWKAALAEFEGGYRRHAAMDEEMALMEMVMLAKLSYPRHFHFLKGNHENVLNEEGNGNHPFRKFALEGEMVLSWMKKFYSDDFLFHYAAFERNLPLFAVGGRFLASHAEPARAFTEAEIVEARTLPEVVEGLTWTDNGAAEPGSVLSLLGYYLPDIERPRFFTGHRVVLNLYRERSGGYHLQIHNPRKYVAAWVMPDRDVEPSLDIGEIRDISRRVAGRWSGEKKNGRTA
jgi:hypothetical protein